MSKTLSPEQQQMEKEANQFAMALLMPAAFLRADFANACPDGIDLVEDQRIISLADRYRVTPQMMILRLHQLELISHE